MGFKASITPIYGKDGEGFREIIGYKEVGETESQRKSNAVPRRIHFTYHIIESEKEQKQAEKDKREMIEVNHKKCYRVNEDIMKANLGPKKVEKPVPKSKFKRKRFTTNR